MLRGLDDITVMLDDHILKAQVMLMSGGGDGGGGGGGCGCGCGCGGVGGGGGGGAYNHIIAPRDNDAGDAG